MKKCNLKLRATEGPRATETRYCVIIHKKYNDNMHSERFQRCVYNKMQRMSSIILMGHEFDKNNAGKLKFLGLVKS
jgi:hypothetical protein